MMPIKKKGLRLVVSYKIVKNRTFKLSSLLNKTSVMGVIMRHCRGALYGSKRALNNELMRVQETKEI